ncbi:hypothetical protein KZ483_19620 [Paenibacillus sp. sptzw28]|uniref:hypothetical protein n=1 Tax=Paenibacillus sp. sptzw28 TaxID=715179 RepID=UPI001C6E863C|nr:hypothetical protein [Paenibacillus sp. sptzw28]QYR20057.1 hypothetical protein KZ483_19620 [Paenibacillus sp. sptzw28]
MTKRKFALSLRVKLLLLVAFPILMYVCSTLYWTHTYESDVTKLSKTLFETTYKVNTLILNADRDLYQSLTAYQAVGSPGLDAETKKQMKQDMASNAEQASDRIEQAIGIISDNGLLELKKKGGDTSISSIAAAFRADFPVWLGLAVKGIETGSNTVYDKKLMDQFGKAREGINIIGEILEEHAAGEIVGI